MFKNLTTIEVANVLKYGILIVLILNLVGYDCFGIIHSLNDTSDPTKRYLSDTVFFCCTSLSWVVMAHTLGIVRSNLFQPFKWLAVLTTILIAYTWNAFLDEAFFDPQKLGWNELVFGILTPIFAVRKYIKK